MVGWFLTYPMFKKANELFALKWRRESILDVYELLFGLFLFFSPWLFAYAQSTSRLDAWLSGAAIVVTSIIAIVIFSEWEEWINFLLGLWLIIAPWTLGFAHTAAMHVSIGIGITIAYLALLDLWMIYYLPFASDQTKGSAKALQNDD